MSGSLSGGVSNSGVDVSVVLNMHREALFLRPTLVSLQECALEARAHGIDVELVAVFDRSDALTRDVFKGADLSAFSRVEIVEVDVGSLGLARNAGVDRACGEYVWTSDADDLVSSNAIVVLWETARSHPQPRVAVFIENLCAFGEQYHNVRYVGSELLTAADFVFQHPYVSRIFIPRAAFDAHRYADLRVTSGFAYEDWDFNCTLRAEGYDFAVAPRTVLFYRQRPDSLLKQANLASTRLIPPNPLFDPPVFLADMQASRERRSDWDRFMQERRAIFDSNNTQAFRDSEILMGFLHDAARLEPELEPHRVETATSYSPIPWDANHWGMQLEMLYRLAGANNFTDVVLLPWLRPGGAEKYILQILEEITACADNTRILVITGEAAPRHEWIKRLPASAVFIDLFNTFHSLSSSDQDAMLVRALLALGRKGARLHLKSSVFGHRFFDAYAAVLREKFQVVYYRFSDGFYHWKKSTLRGPWGVNFMRRHLAGFAKVISDCDAIGQQDQACLGTLQSKYETLYAKCEAVDAGLSLEAPRHRLLWASRVSHEKRPELVGRIARKLHECGLAVTIEAFGAVDGCVQLEEVFPKANERVRYRGGFMSFAELPVASFDAFLYTSAFDGLPNVLLEAMSAGLPVVAPDVGGIREAVIAGATGWLVPAADDDDVLVDRYVQAIRSVYADWQTTRSFSGNARRLLQTRHDGKVFNQRVAEIFDFVAEPG